MLNGVGDSLEVGHAGGLPGLGVGVALGVVSEPLPGPRGRLDGDPVLGVRLQPRQLRLVRPVVEDLRLPLQLGPNVGAHNLGEIIFFFKEEIFLDKRLRLLQTFLIFKDFQKKYL